MRSSGATHVVDRNSPVSNFSENLKSITDKPLGVVFDAVSSTELRRAAYEALAPTGKIIVVSANLGHGLDVSPNKEVVLVFAHSEVGAKLYQKLPELLESGEIKVGYIREL